MKKILLFIAVFSLTGCFVSKVPISSSKESNFDEKLIGNWIGKNMDADDDLCKLVILKFNSNEYFISWQVGDDVAALARGYITELDDIRIINTQNIKGNVDRIFIFFKYFFSENGNLLVSILNGMNPLLQNKTFNISEEFHSFLKENIDDKRLFKKVYEFFKHNKVKISLSS